MYGLSLSCLPLRWGIRANAQYVGSPVVAGYTWEGAVVLYS